MRTHHIVALSASLLVVLLQSPSALAEQSPPLADAVVDLRTVSSAAAVEARWRYADVSIVPAPRTATTADATRGTTFDITPKVGTPEFDNSATWQTISPGALEVRRTIGRLAFGWYRLNLTIPEYVGGVSTTGSTIVLEVVVDDYAEVWVNGRAPLTLGSSGGAAIKGWNAPSRVVIARDAKPDQRCDVAIFAANGPLSNPPANQIWIRSATLEIYSKGNLPGGGPTPVELGITRLDPALDAVVPPGTRAEKVAEGFTFIEGPVWIPESSGSPGEGGFLLFSEPNRNVIHRWDPQSGEVSIFRTKSGYSGVEGADLRDYHQPGSNGLALDSAGRLTICEHGNRRITRLEPRGQLTVLADRFEGKRLNSPNDLVYSSDGTLFFTDPPFGLPKTFDDRRKEIPFSGVFRLKDGVLTLAARDLGAPNGLAFSPDEKHLYVDNWEQARKVVLRYDVSPSGELSNATTFFDMTSSPGEICLDGLKVDHEGNVFVAGPGGIWILSPQGTHLGTLTLPELPANFTFGGSDGRTLFVCARSGLYRIQFPPRVERTSEE
jgi:gluconolactonase